jgi:eukaryotic-like serine/threonine-protein kinase
MAGRTIAERYELRGRLGTGGMSTVQRAFDRVLEREVAVKLLAEHLAEDDTFVSRFRREALAAARLVHPNIVQVFDFGLDDSTGQHYIVMELVEGKSGAEILRDERVLQVAPALDIIVQACRGLDHAHRNGVVHRDVKPGNLLRSNDGVVKLADFGIAKAGEQSSITQVGSVLGTAAYLAPEQARGEEAGPAADLYALGVVAYQLLSGRLPYEASSLSELALKQQRELPPLLSEVNPQVPEPLARGVARALSLDAAARYPDALSMAEALRDAERGIEPPAALIADGATEATHVVGPAGETAATHMLAPQDPATPVSQQRRPRAEPLPPRPREARGPARRQAAAPKRKRHRVRRTLLVLLLLAAAIVAGVVVVSNQLSTQPRLRQVASQDAQSAIDEVKQLIRDNTR